MMAKGFSLLLRFCADNLYMKTQQYPHNDTHTDSNLLEDASMDS